MFESWRLFVDKTKTLLSLQKKFSLYMECFVIVPDLPTSGDVGLSIYINC